MSDQDHSQGIERQDSSFQDVERRARTPLRVVITRTQPRLGAFSNRRRRATDCAPYVQQPTGRKPGKG